MHTVKLSDTSIAGNRNVQNQTDASRFVCMVFGEIGLTEAVQNILPEARSG